MVERGCRQVAGRVPVLVGVTDTSFAESDRLADLAGSNGAQAVVLAPPPYFAASQMELVGYVERFTLGVSLPTFVYHIPSLTKVAIEPETVRRLLDIPRVAGLKDSGRDMHYLHAVRLIAAERHDFSVLVGPEELLAEAVLLGAHGGMCGGANMAPRLYVDLYHAARAGDLPRLRELHRARHPYFVRDLHGERFRVELPARAEMCAVVPRLMQRRYGRTIPAIFRSGTQHNSRAVARPRLAECVNPELRWCV